MAAIDGPCENRSVTDAGIPPHGWATEVPVSWNPISICPVSGDPCISRSGAGRNVSDRSAHIHSEFGRLSRRRSQARYASQHCCTKHPVPYAAHNPSIPAGPRFTDSGPASVRLGLVSCRLPRVPFMSYANTAYSEGCDNLLKTFSRNFPANWGLWQSFWRTADSQEA